MAESVLTLTMAQMVDVALGSPELGTINFNVLQSLLHVLMQQLNLVKTNVEIRGKEAERMKNIMINNTGANKINVTEYIILPDGRRSKPRSDGRRRRESLSKKRGNRQKSKDSILKGSNENDIPEETDSNKKSSRDSSIASSQRMGSEEGSIDTIVVVNKVDGSGALPQLTISLTKKKYEELENGIVEIKEKINELMELPHNLGIVEALRSNKKPVVHAFQLLSLKKRLDATETSLSKLASLMEDLIVEMQDGDTREPEEKQRRTEKVRKSVNSIKEEHNAELANQRKNSLQILEDRIDLLEQIISQDRRSVGPASIHALDDTNLQLSREMGLFREQLRVIFDSMRSLNPKKVQKVKKQLKNIATLFQDDKVADKIVTQQHMSLGLADAESSLVGIPLDITENQMLQFLPELESLSQEEVETLFGDKAEETMADVIGINFIDNEENFADDTSMGKTDKFDKGNADESEKEGIAKDIIESLGKVSAGKVSLGKLSFGKESVRKESLGKDSVEKESGGKASVGKASVGKQSVGKDSVGRRSLGRDQGKYQPDESLGSSLPGSVFKAIAFRITTIEEKFQNYLEALKSIDNQYASESKTLRTQFNELERTLNVVLERMNFMTSETQGQDVDTVSLYNKSQEMQEHLTHISELVQKLNEDRADKERDFEVLIEQIEVLKTIKADREDLEDALADKADACAVTRKVSYDQFDAACDDLSKGIEEAIEKLCKQESLWGQALTDIQSEMGHKLDKMELGPLRDFVNNKLKLLQERVKELTAMKEEREAASSKNKLLRDINCLSCDKDVVMRKEIDSFTKPKMYALPPTRSMGPYLAYELDALRKQQKCLPTSKNLNYFEGALQGKVESTKDHICNRYCGGSHTITTPQQRVTRLGHFITQWGTEVIKCTEDVIKTEDGTSFKGDLIDKDVVPTKLPPIKVTPADLQKNSSDPISSAAEKEQTSAKLSKLSIREDRRSQGVDRKSIISYGSKTSQSSSQGGADVRSILSNKVSQDRGIEKKSLLSYHIPSETRKGTSNMESEQRIINPDEDRKSSASVSKAPDSRRVSLMFAEPRRFSTRRSEQSRISLAIREGAGRQQDISQENPPASQTASVASVLFEKPSDAQRRESQKSKRSHSPTPRISFVGPEKQTVIYDDTPEEEKSMPVQNMIPSVWYPQQKRLTFPEKVSFSLGKPERPTEAPQTIKEETASQISDDRNSASVE